LVGAKLTRATTERNCTLLISNILNLFETLARASVSLTYGAFDHVVLWVNPEPGLYDIIADTNSNGHYDVSINALDSKDSLDVTPGGTSGFFVVPEYAFGGLASLAACFIGFVIFKKRSQLHL
jgi:hypothetical protein